MKLVKQLRYNKNGESKINCYHVNIPRAILKETNIKDTDNIKIYVSNNKIIIEKE